MNNCLIEHSFVFRFVHFYTNIPQFIPLKKRGYPHRFLPVFPFVYKGLDKCYPPIHSLYYEYYYILYLYIIISVKKGYSLFSNEKDTVFFCLLKIVYGVCCTAVVLQTIGN